MHANRAARTPHVAWKAGATPGLEKQDFVGLDGTSLGKEVTATSSQTRGDDRYVRRSTSQSSVPPGNRFSTRVHNVGYLQFCGKPYSGPNQTWKFRLSRHSAILLVFVSFLYDDVSLTSFGACYLLRCNISFCHTLSTPYCANNRVFLLLSKLLQRFKFVNVRIPQSVRG